MHQLDKHIHGPDIMSFFFNLIPLANSMNCSLFVFITRNIGDKRMVLLEGLILQCVRNLVDFIPYFF